MELNAKSGVLLADTEFTDLHRVFIFNHAADNLPHGFQYIVLTE